LSSQFRRAAVSIASNIAEGFRKRSKADKKRSKADKIRFLNIAQGSIAQGSVKECRYYLILTKDLGYGDTYETKLLLQEVSKLLEAYSRGILTPDS